MDSDEFKKFGKAGLDFIVDYLENVRERKVLPSVEPGYLHELLPKEMPSKPEHWKDIMKDLEKYIMPGITHWQSPNFHGYFTAGTSYPAIIGDMIAAGFGVIGVNWLCSPACTELEVIMMDWLGKFLNLPEQFLTSSPGNGGGIIQGSASESMLIALIAAREQKVKHILNRHPEVPESDIRGKFVAYANVHGNSAVEKTGLLGAVKMKSLEADEHCSLRGSTLKRQIEEDKAAGLIPLICLATIGTTGTCGYDNLEEIGKICEGNKIWLHVDAAYAGAAFCLPEYKHLLKGMEYVDSLNYSLHKWMLIYFECTAMWLKDASLLTSAMNVDRIYLAHQFQGNSKAPDYRHWQIALGRRFRSLRVWFTLRVYGQEKIREMYRQQINLAKTFRNHVLSDERFEIISSELGLVCFRLRGDCYLSKRLLEILTERKNLYMVPSVYQNKFIIRFAVCGFDPKETDIDYAWKEIQFVTDEMFENISNSIDNTAITRSKL